MAYAVCPYLMNGSRCNISDVIQSSNQKDTYCMSSDKWKKCANYEKASPQSKATKMVK